MILISKWCNQCIYILDEESVEYGDTNNDNENYERDNNKNRRNKTIAIDDESNDMKDVYTNYNNKEETRNDSTKETVRYDAKGRTFVFLNV